MWLICMVLHGPNFWKWIVGPAVLFTLEKFYFIGKSFRYQTTVDIGMVHGNVSRSYHCAYYVLFGRIEI